MRNERRLITGAIIGIVGLVLLIGGGTLALWFDTESISGADVTSGELSLDIDPAQGAWSNQSGPIADIATYLIVPGDVLTLTQPVDITAVGDELTAELSLDATQITGDPDLAAALDVGMAIPAPPAGLTGGPDVFDVTGDLGTATVDVEVQITFPETTDGAPPAADRSNYWNLTAQNETISLTSIAFDLVQVTA